jgi:hypothetical protein
MRTPVAPVRARLAASRQLSAGSRRSCSATVPAGSDSSAATTATSRPERVATSRLAGAGTQRTQGRSRACPQRCLDVADHDPVVEEAATAGHDEHGVRRLQPQPEGRSALQHLRAARAAGEQVVDELAPHRLLGP